MRWGDLEKNFIIINQRKTIIAIVLQIINLDNKVMIIFADIFDTFDMDGSWIISQTKWTNANQELENWELLSK